jgi:uncharacterized protein YjdB
MADGRIEGNTAEYGGGVYLLSGTFNITNGIITGDNYPQPERRNHATTSSSAIIITLGGGGVVQYGTFDADNNWLIGGNIVSTGDTVHVVDGVLQGATSAPTVYVLSITFVDAGAPLVDSTIYLLPGGTVQLEFLILPDNATNQDVTWYSSDDTIATVSNTGYVEMQAVLGATGYTIITVTTDCGGYYATIRVQIDDSSTTP